MVPAHNALARVSLLIWNTWNTFPSSSVTTSIAMTAEHAYNRVRRCSLAHRRNMFPTAHPNLRFGMIKWRPNPTCGHPNLRFGYPNLRFWCENRTRWCPDHRCWCGNWILHLGAQLLVCLGNRIGRPYHRCGYPNHRFERPNGSVGRPKLLDMGTQI